MRLPSAAESRGAARRSRRNRLRERARPGRSGLCRRWLSSVRGRVIRCSGQRVFVHQPERRATLPLELHSRAFFSCAPSIAVRGRQANGGRPHGQSPRGSEDFESVTKARESRYSRRCPPQGAVRRETFCELNRTARPRTLSSLRRVRRGWRDLVGPIRWPRYGGPTNMRRAFERCPHSKLADH